MNASPYEYDVHTVMDKGRTQASDKSLIAVVAEWVQHNFQQQHNRIADARNLGSGWEIWCQTELGLYINAVLGPGTATREAAIYERNLYADLVIYDTRGPNGVATHIVELKCNGTGTGNTGTMMMGLQNDFSKLMKEKYGSGFDKARRWVIGIHVGAIQKPPSGEWHVEEVRNFETQVQLYFRDFGGI
jgi:hypothetical protein